MSARKTAKRSKRTAIVFMAAAVVVFGSVVYSLKKTEEPPTSKADESTQCSVNAEELLGYINEERAKLGAPKLTVDPTLASTARQKLDDMVARKYYAHTTPDGDDFSKIIRDAGVNAAVSEDIGASDYNAAGAWAGFKVSPNHYKSLTNPKYTRVGIAASCTDYRIEAAVEGEDKAYLGTYVSSLSVVHLAGQEPGL